tara:strand:- start:174 stop:353 length:180 start_codon:yes stop_codon:yes gene_type:complete
MRERRGEKAELDPVQINLSINIEIDHIKSRFCDFALQALTIGITKIVHNTEGVGSRRMS